MHDTRSFRSLFGQISLGLTNRLLLLLICGFSVDLADATDRTAAISKLTVEPASIRLRGDNRRQQLLVTATLDDGRMVDVTRRAAIESDDDAIIRCEDGAVAGVASGDSHVRIRIDGRETSVHVSVIGVEDEPPVDFSNDLEPLFSKLGCNSGGCHGKASGQNGFKLSVFGFDAVADYESLVKEARGRRVFAADARSSLLLKKATGLMPHGGGQRLKLGTRDYELLEAWLKQGAPLEQPNSPKLIGLAVSPRSRVMEPSSHQQLLVTAQYADGTYRDVTSAAGYASNAPLIAEADRSGLVRIGHVTGEAAVTVHYMGQVASVMFQVPRSDAATSFDFPVQNGIDELVLEKLRTMRIVPAALADDATFLRRLYLDAIGTLPTVSEMREFLNDGSINKRPLWIERALARPEYADYWAMVWSDILLVDRQKLGERGAYELHHWLLEQFARNRPYDQWVAELITATGNSGTNGPANLFRAVDTPDDLAKTFTQAFLGVRMECAQCHHHPFEKWSQDDFYGVAGFFNGLERKPISTGRVFVYHGGLKETRIPVSNKLVPTRPLDGPVFAETDSDPRRFFAQWLISPNNPWFARLIGNRIWKHYVGRGLVEPEDDLRSTNPATNERLLARLAERVVEAKFDLKEITRFVLNSRTYQLSSQTNDTNRDDDQNFSHRYVKRLPAEVLLDAIGQVTGDPEAFAGCPPGTRAIQLWDNRLPSYFLEIFGRPERTSPCECGRTSEPTMSQALHLMNAPEIELKIGSRHGTVARLLEKGATNAAIVDELCLAALGRLPRHAELAVANRLFATADKRQASEDFLWSLLNSYDFLFVK